MSIDNPKTIEQSRMVGQDTAVRYFNSSDEEDMKRLLAMVQNPKSQKWMTEVSEMEMKDVIEWAKQRGKSDQEECLFAVSGSPSGVSPDEVGEVQAFINSYEVKGDLLNRMIEKGYVHPSDSPVIEVSAAKNPSSKFGQVGSGLIQVCFQLNQMLNSHKNELEPSLQIVAFVDPNNKNAINSLDDSCLDYLGEMQYGDDDNKLDKVYSFNWSKAQSFLHQEANKSIQ